MKRIEGAPSPIRHVDAGGESWVVREIPAPSFDRRGGTHLLFESEQIVRRVRFFPADWMERRPAAKRVWLAWSSGKDSAWALHVLRRDPDVEVTGLLTTLNGQANRVAMHGVRREVLEAQAAAVGLPLHVVNLPSPCSNEDYEHGMAGAFQVALSRGATHVAFGDLFLSDVRAYRERQLAGTGLDPLFPVWASEKETPDLAHRMVAEGTRALIVCVDTEQLPAHFLGREFDEQLLKDLPASVDPCGERGEFHTLCFGGPAFHSPLQPRAGHIVRDGRFHFVDQRLEGKTS